MTPALEAALVKRLGKPLRASPVAGGDINQAVCWESANGERYFIKWNSALGAADFAAEARGLALLSAADHPLVVPGVLDYGEESGTGFIVLEWLERVAATAVGWRALGEGLAALHRNVGSAYGLDHDNLIGRLPQPNGPLSTWPRFWAERRIGFQLRLAVDGGRLEGRLSRRIERLCAECDKLCAHAGQAPVLLHGDLWGGNVMFVADRPETSRPAIIDPAVYYGDREVELAFTELFGGFDRDFYAAYQAAFALDPGYAERRGFWQLYPLLVHLNLFGAGYLGSVERAVSDAEQRL